MYNFAFMDPYATVDGVSSWIQRYILEKLTMENITSQIILTNSAGLGCSVWISYIRYTKNWPSILTYDKTDIDIRLLCPLEKFMILLHQKVNVFETLSANFVWSRVTLNRGLFPTDGSSTSLSLMTTLTI